MSNLSTAPFIPDLKRAVSRRRERLAAEMRKLLGSFLISQDIFKQAGTSVFNVTHVQVSKDLGHVRFAIDPGAALDPLQKKSLLASFHHLKAPFKRYVSTQLKLRKAPQISFELDEMIEAHMHIQGLLEQARAQSQGFLNEPNSE